MSPEEAYLHSSKHRDEILASKTCGCFHCLRIFAPSEISRWTDQRNGVGQTAFCPACAIDSVLGDRGVPITATLLEQMRARYFGVPSRADAERVWTAIREAGVPNIVDIEFRTIEVETGEPTTVRIALEVHFRSDRSVCCPELSCYIPFLGAGRRHLASLIRTALQLPDTPELEITVQTIHEPGFTYASIGAAVDHEVTYSPSHFQSST